ncbi:DUF1676 domain-containing protein Osi18 [Arctopsyche grandis]|uniref:DUF1676 domain-containing protein Osi18 n=1 Tax=Arctopsyche grandis TaxID=121162 RepID=UPI00406DA0B6
MAKLLVLLVVAAVAVNAYEDSASQLAYDVYKGCLSQYSVSCVKPKALSWLSRVADKDEIKLTEDLTIVRTSYAEESISRDIKDDKYQMFENIDDFLATHTLKIKVPEELSSGPAGEYVPRSLLQGLPKELDVPLSEGNVAEGRGFVKKVMIPFLLGLKFKASVLVPIALALIALKTWKALTLGLISLVLSGAMVIFKFTKPKVVNYEVLHYPHHDHHLEHVAAPGWDHHHGPYQRSFDDAQNMAYNAYL